MFRKSLFIFFSVACVFIIAQAQQYPVWFIRQGWIKSVYCAVGYAENTPQKDSIPLYLQRSAEKNYASFKFVEFKGEQAFWGTEAGKYRIAASSIENIRQSDIDESQKVFRLATKYLSKDTWFGLCCDSSTELSLEMQKMVDCRGLASPSWIDSVPKAEGLIYGVGFSPLYYHELSSWLEAERLARRNLALSVTSKSQGLQKSSSSSSEDVEVSKSNVVLKDIRVIERWFDGKNKICYVLVQCTIQ